MKLTTRTILAALMLAGSASAMAAPRLTQHECNGYPFMPLKGEVTHKQLMRELAELEAQGYDPGVDDATYPDNLEAAQAKLMAQYRADCLPAKAFNSTQGSGGPATSPSPATSNLAG